MNIVFTMFDNDFTNDILPVVKEIADEICISYLENSLDLSDKRRIELADAIAFHSGMFSSIHHHNSSYDIEHIRKYCRDKLQISLVDGIVDDSLWGSDKVCMILNTGFIWIV